MMYLLKYCTNCCKSIKISKLCRFYSEKSLDVNTNVTKDVILFKYDQPRLYRMINIFAVAQFAFWSYISYFSYTTLKNVPVLKTNENLPWWRTINLGEDKYRRGMAIMSFGIGYGVLLITWMYTLRSVRYLILRKGGQSVTFVTYTPFGKNRLMDINLNYVNCKESRSAAKSQLPIKVKGHFLHYILDMRGEFRQPHLFDHTAGCARKFL